MQALEAEDPQAGSWTARRRHFAMHRGCALLHAGQAQAALPRLQDACTAWRRPLPARRWAGSGWCALECAGAFTVLGREAEAQAAAAAAVADLQAWLQQSPDDGEARARLAQARRFSL